MTEYTIPSLTTANPVPPDHKEKDLEHLAGTDVIWYDAEGNILQWGFLQRMVLDQLQKNGERIVEGIGRPETEFVDPKSKKVGSKKPSPVTLNGTNLASVPKGSRITITDSVGGQTVDTAREASVELILAASGHYVVEVSHGRYLSKQFELDVP
jgi:hypothetical protein